MVAVVAAVAVGCTDEMSGWMTSAARNTMSDWETVGRGPGRASANTLCM